MKAIRVRPIAVRVYRITRDVTGEAYKILLEAALSEASSFSLVWRTQLRFAPSATAVRKALRGLQLRHVKGNRWPGTILLGHGQCASIVTYRAAPEALPTLLEPGSLFAWRSPAYPEDLSFGTDRTVCLATVSHEANAWILSPSLASAVGHKVTLVRETMDQREAASFKPI
jgi:hypothetical protein